MGTESVVSTGTIFTFESDDPPVREIVSVVRFFGDLMTIKFFGPDINRDVPSDQAPRSLAGF
jgi:hypothetical protein